MGNITLTMIKPDAYGNGYTGKILDRIIEAGFELKAMRLLHMNAEQAGKFYAVHKERPFYNDLVSFMSSGPIVAAVLKKDNAVADFRKLIGATNPEQADAGTIRKDFAENIERNAIHGSDSDENALKEARFFFSELEEVV